MRASTFAVVFAAGAYAQQAADTFQDDTAVQAPATDAAAAPSQPAVESAPAAPEASAPAEPEHSAPAEPEASAPAEPEHSAGAAPEEPAMTTSVSHDAEASAPADPAAPVEPEHSEAAVPEDPNASAPAPGATEAPAPTDAEEPVVETPPAVNTPIVDAGNNTAFPTATASNGFGTSTLVNADPTGSGAPEDGEVEGSTGAAGSIEAQFGLIGAAAAGIMAFLA